MASALCFIAKRNPLIPFAWTKDLQHLLPGEFLNRLSIMRVPLTLHKESLWSWIFAVPNNLACLWPDLSWIWADCMSCWIAFCAQCTAFKWSHTVGRFDFWHVGRVITFTCRPYSGLGQKSDFWKIRNNPFRCESRQVNPAYSKSADLNGDARTSWCNRMSFPLVNFCREAKPVMFMSPTAGIKQFTWPLKTRVRLFFRC